MSNNTLKHISDSASTVTFDPAGTSFGGSITDVQAALAGLGSHALIDGLPDATTSLRGVLRVATESEVDDGTGTSSAITPATLAYALSQPNANETDIGWTRYATNTEAMNTSFENAATTPKNVHHVFENRNATETTFGTARLSTASQATAGSNNTTIMTPLRVKQAIDALVPTVATATESVEGSVRLATVAQTQSGTLRDGYAVSPYTFRNTNATESNFGTIRIATTAQTTALSNDTVAITPAKLNALNASTSQKGLVTLANNSETAALSISNKAITPSALGNMDASTSQRGIVRLATEAQVRAWSSNSLVITPAALRQAVATNTQWGITRLSNSLTSTSVDRAATSNAAKVLNDKIESVISGLGSVDVIFNGGQGVSASSVFSYPKSALDGCEWTIIHRGRRTNEAYTTTGTYSQRWNNGGITRSGSASMLANYNATLQRFELPDSADRFIMIYRKRIPQIPTGLPSTPPPPPPPPFLPPWPPTQMIP